MPFPDAVYDLPGISEKIASEKQRTKTLRPAFNICSRRFPKTKQKDNMKLLGFLNPPDSKFQLPSAAFKSKKDKVGFAMIHGVRRKGLGGLDEGVLQRSHQGQLLLS